MKTRLLTFLLFLVTAPAFADTFGTGDNQFTIDFVTVGNPGNPADTTGDPNPAGAVPYVYNIGKYEISRDAIEKANLEGGLGITLADMSFVTGGTRAEMPATEVTWNEAARFVNYLNTSQGYPAAYKFGKQPGEVGYDPNANISLWQAGDPGYDANNLFRNSLAHYSLPSTDEWYKAAYYDPNANGGAGGYWDYPTGSDSIPTPVASGTDAGTAVWGQVGGPADTRLAGGLSPYGTMAQGGNVLEWEEDGFLFWGDPSAERSLQGGYWWNYGVHISPLALSATSRGSADPNNEEFFNGFRVASIPEPSTAYLGALSTIGLLRWRRRAN